MTPRFPVLNYYDLSKLARERGFILWRQAKSSHEIWKRISDGRRTVIPNHGSKPVKRKTIKSILEDLEIDIHDMLR